MKYLFGQLWHKAMILEEREGNSLCLLQFHASEDFFLEDAFQGILPTCSLFQLEIPSSLSFMEKRNVAICSRIFWMPNRLENSSLLSFAWHPRRTGMVCAQNDNATWACYVCCSRALCSCCSDVAQTMCVHVTRRLTQAHLGCCASCGDAATGTPHVSTVLP